MGTFYVRVWLYLFGKLLKAGSCLCQTLLSATYKDISVDLIGNSLKIICNHAEDTVNSMILMPDLTPALAPLGRLL
jgi:hypothetical protein